MPSTFKVKVTVMVSQIMMLLPVKNSRRDPRSFPFRLFTLKTCVLFKFEVLCFVADNILVIFLELVVFALLLHVKIRMPIKFSILRVEFSILAVDVLDRPSLGGLFSDTNRFFNHSNRQS